MNSFCGARRRRWPKRRRRRRALRPAPAVRGAPLLRAPCAHQRTRGSPPEPPSQAGPRLANSPPIARPGAPAVHPDSALRGPTGPSRSSPGEYFTPFDPEMSFSSCVGRRAAPTLSKRNGRQGSSLARRGARKGCAHAPLASPHPAAQARARTPPQHRPIAHLR